MDHVFYFFLSLLLLLLLLLLLYASILAGGVYLGLSGEPIKGSNPSPPLQWKDVLPLRSAGSKYAITVSHCCCYCIL